MKIKSKTIEYQLDPGPDAYVTVEGQRYHVTDIRIEFTPGEDDGYQSDRLYGYRIRKDGERAANAAYGQIFGAEFRSDEGAELISRAWKYVEADRRLAGGISGR